MTTAELTERRELGHRTNDGIDVTLYWSKASGRVTVSVLHLRSATALEFEVDGADALDAFNHPFAYAATGGAHHITTPRGVTAPWASRRTPESRGSHAFRPSVSARRSTKR